MITVDFDNENFEKDLYNKIKGYLNSDVNLFPGKYEIYFSGEEDVNLITKFEEQSNNLEIGVITNNPDKAALLLYLVRHIIDKHNDRLFIDMLYENYQGQEFNLDKIIRLIGIYEEQYLYHTSINSAIFRKLNDGEIVTKEIYQIDLWTQKRTFDKIDQLFA